MMRSVVRRPRPSARPAARVLAGAALGLALAVPAGASGAAPAPTPSCGSTLTVDTTLQADVTCPTGSGFTLAEGVTLDLGGHVLRGNPEGTGVLASETGDNAVVNGTITGWATSVDTGYGGAHMLVDRVRVVGGRLGGFPVLVVRRSRLESVSLEITFGEFSGSRVEDSVVRDSIVAVTDAGLALERSSFVRTSLSASEALISADRSRFLGRGGTEVGFDLYWSDLDLSRSTLSGFGTAITGSMSYLDIARSVLHRNGIAVRTRPNLYGGDAHIQRSTFAANGVALDLADNATVRGNLLVRNRRGIVAAPLGPGPEPTTSSVQLYEGNTVALTRGTGITATGPVVTLTRNVVFGSRGQAIVATDVVDGGGNRAFRNRGRPQCVGVVCEER